MISSQFSLGAFALSASLLAGCGSDATAQNGHIPIKTDAGNDGAGGTAGSSGTGGAAGADDAGDGEAGGAAGYAGSCNDSRYGFNDQMPDPKPNGQPCSVIDIDKIGNRMGILCGFPVNRYGGFDVDTANPMASAKTSFGDGENGHIADTWQSTATQKKYNVSPIEISQLSSGKFVVPGKLELIGGTEVSNALAFLDSNADPLPLHAIDTALLPGNIKMNVKDIRTPVFSNGRMYVPATDVATNDGVMLSYGVRAAGDIDENDVQNPLFLSGKNPSATVKLDANRIAVVNAGGPSSAQLDAGTQGASIDVLRTSLKDLVKLESVIPLGVPAAVALPELAMTDDNAFAVAAGQDGSIRFVNMQEGQLGVVGSLDLQHKGNFIDPIDIRGIAVDGRNAYVSFEGKTGNGGADERTGKVAWIDFTDPAAPNLVLVIDVSFGLGAISAGNGMVVVASSRLGCEGPAPTPTGDAGVGIPYWRLIKLDPAKIKAGPPPVTDSGAPDADSDAKQD